MSPSWRERILVGLAPGTLSALRYTLGLRPRLADQVSLPLEAGTPAWGPAVETLRNLLANPQWSKGELTITLSEHFVRYALVPGEAKLRSPAERFAHAGIALEKVYGRFAADWEPRVSPAQGAEPTLASGVDRALLKKLRELGGASARLVAIRPLLMAAFNRVRRSLYGGTAAIALAEPGRMTVALLTDGQWAGVAARAAAQPQGADIRQLLDEQCALGGLEAGGALALHDLTGACQLSADGSWQVEAVSLPGGAALDAQFRLAAMGVQ